MLAECNSNSSGRDVAGSVGNLSVQYGATSNNAAGGTIKLAFADGSRVQKPATGTRFDV